MSATDRRYSGGTFWPFLACAFCCVGVGCSGPAPTAPTTPTTTAPVSTVCHVGRIVGPEQSCTVGDERFEVDRDGRGCLIAGSGNMVSRFCSSTRVAVDGFDAIRLPDTNDWRIEANRGGP